MVWTNHIKYFLPLPSWLKKQRLVWRDILQGTTKIGSFVQIKKQTEIWWSGKDCSDSGRQTTVWLSTDAKTKSIWIWSLHFHVFGATWGRELNRIIKLIRVMRKLLMYTPTAMPKAIIQTVFTHRWQTSFLDFSDCEAQILLLPAHFITNSDCTIDVCPHAVRRRITTQG